jgi:hypothetical protein
MSRVEHLAVSVLLLTACVGENPKKANDAQVPRARNDAQVSVSTADSEHAQRSVSNFLFGLDALARADSRQTGVDGDANVHRVAAIFREAIDSAAFINRSDLNQVHSGLGDHFLDDGIRHMRMLVQIEQTRDDASMEQAIASIVAWQRWWNANRLEAMKAITSRYSR